MERATLEVRGPPVEGGVDQPVGVAEPGAGEEGGDVVPGRQGRDQGRFR